MTRDIVIAFFLKDIDRLDSIFGEDFFYRKEAAKQAILHSSSLNVIHNDRLIKIDFMIGKREEFRLLEFERRQRIDSQGHSLWIASKEDLILSKLEWERHSQSRRQLSDVENLLATGVDQEYLQIWSQN